MNELKLKKSKLSSALRKRLDRYYSKLPGAGPAYLAARWQEWTENRDVIAFQAGSADETAGWIVYNPETSTVLDRKRSHKSRMRSFARRPSFLRRYSRQTNRNISG